MNIFERLAPSYWQAGLPAIPLKPQSKAPAISSWQHYCSAMPTTLEQEAWLHDYPNGNIGLALGPKSGLCMVDIDDDEVEEAIRSVLPAPIWERRGKKGCQLAYRATPGLEGFQLKLGRATLVELLYTGRQAVLPGSIHPDCSACGGKKTAGPEGKCKTCGSHSLVYTSNCDLWEVV